MPHSNMLARLPLLVAAYHLIPSLDTASGVSKTEIRNKNAAHLVEGLILIHANLHHRSNSGFGFLCR